MPIKMTNKRFVYLLGNCFCHCGKLRQITPSGAVCPDHKLVMGIDRRDLKDAIFADKLNKMPIATFDKPTLCWLIDGKYYVVANKAHVHYPQIYVASRIIEARIETEEYWLTSEFIELRHLMAAL